MATIQNVQTVNNKSKCHKVTQDGAGWQVVSGVSGEVYQVNTRNDGGFTCTCNWGFFRNSNDNRSACSHVQAVVSFTNTSHKLKAKAAWYEKRAKAVHHRKVVSLGDGVVIVARKG